MHCVIGSGPAGAACAKALLARGESVLMLDAGIELENDRAEIVRELAGKKFSDWTPQQLTAVQGDLAATAKGIPLKMLFGSDFPYRETEEKIPWRGHGIGFRPSLALGGLSNVWGAAALPYRDADISNWPIKTADLAPHYRAAAEIMGLAARRDDLEEILPLYSENPSRLQSSRQAQSFLARLEKHRDRLNSRGWHFGQSRLAVRATDSPRGSGCVYCGQCMTGCIYGCIYNSADTIRELRPDKNFSYRGNVVVTRLREDGGAVLIEGFDRQTRAPLTFETKRVYLAAGVIPTAQILLRSQNAFDCALTLRDSQYFLFPVLLAKRTRDLKSETLHTLSQVFLELNSPQISPRGVHLQVYTYSDIIAQAVRHSLGPLKMFARPFVERLLIAQGYLHSDESATVEMRLKRDGEKDFLQLDAKPNPRTKPVIKKVLRELAKQFRALGGVPVPPMLQIAEPGRGYHIGGSIPMRAEPKEFESDLLGRPHGWKNVHVVDASVLPDIPATTITFSVMANAHRIGAAELD
ncbi:MAG TPA: GMC oxidoreductase [Verrucomicrobiae bacterium]|nr:GMC oxidoreductase [Verrucomicrobiae bacterium]